MEFGVGYLPSHRGMSPMALARMVEEHGQESLFFAEHTHIPASRATPVPDGGELPSKYWHSLDLFVALTAAAGASTRLRIGSAICLVIQRDPITTAKQVASVDQLSGGRLEFGVGAGWNREEMRNHGTDPRTRRALMRERIEAMKAIWTQREASYSGEHVSFERILSEPKPLQRPHPPIIVGGDGPTVLDRVLAFGDAWLPAADYHPGTGVIERITELAARAQRPIDVYAYMPAEPHVIERMRAAGVRRALHRLPTAGRSVVEPALERWERAIAVANGG
jgi:probable F420-dependent oxidoreductase